MARECEFVQRKSKLSTSHFLNILLFANKPGKQLSLLDLTGDLYEQFGVRFTKQSLQDRFNANAVRLMKKVLSNILSQQLSSSFKKGRLKKFNRVRIKDSTRFALPECYSDQYQGYGGATYQSASMISIQYEYDLLSDQTLDLRLTNGLCNDQSDARDYTYDIAEKDLFIRDLGYSTTGYLEKIAKNGAYFLNRLAPQTKVYYENKPDKEIDLEACLTKIKKYQLSYIEYAVLIGKKARIPARLIISPVDDATYEKRLRKTRKQAKSYGHKVSDNFCAKARFNLFITNAAKEDIPAQWVQPVYSLRWQIELIFKVWKSQATINNLKEVKIHRFECQLLAKLIWLLIHWKLYRWLDNAIRKENPTYCCSFWKYYKSTPRLAVHLRSIIKKTQMATKFLKLLINRPIEQLTLEKKKGKEANYRFFSTLA